MSLLAALCVQAYEIYFTIRLQMADLLRIPANRESAAKGHHVAHKAEDEDSTLGASPCVAGFAQSAVDIIFISMSIFLPIYSSIYLSTYLNVMCLCVWV